MFCLSRSYLSPSETSARARSVATGLFILLLLRRRSAGRRYLDFNGELRGRKLGFDAGARRRVAGRHPGIPHRVHFGEGRDIGKPDRRRQYFRALASRRSEKLVDLVEDILGLRSDRLAGRAQGYLAGGVDQIAMDDGLAHARTTFDTGDVRHFL